MSPTPNDAEAKAIDAMYAEALKAFEAGDIPGVLDHWSADGEYMWPAIDPAIGKAAIQKAYEGFFANWTANEKYSPEPISISGDLAQRRFGTELSLTPKVGGSPKRMRLNGIHVYRKESGKWMFKVVIATSTKFWSASAVHAHGHDLNEAEEPVSGFPIKFKWHTGPWRDIFDLQIELIRSDIRRARAEDKLIVYLSCPISSRGGGHSGTNVDIAKHVERKLLATWGEGFWILNPAQYQLESKAGTGLMCKHAAELGLNIEDLLSLDRPSGGDYMRMWTTVLVENGATVGQRTFTNPGLLNSGQYFDGFYFIGPRDVQSFFLREGETVTSGVQAYFARKDAMDPEFRGAYSIAGLQWGTASPPPNQQVLLTSWENRRIDFLRYYGLRASANYSLGSHDELLIYKHINARRRLATTDASKFISDGDVGEQLAGFFDGGQIDPGSTELGISRGYSQ